MFEETTMTNTMEENAMVETSEVYNDYEVADNSNDGLAVKVLLGVGAAVGAGIAAWKATKNKREAWAVKRLEKKGYKVEKVEEDEPKKVVVHKVEEVSEEDSEE